MGMAAQDGTTSRFSARLAAEGRRAAMVGRTGEQQVASAEGTVVAGAQWVEQEVRGTCPGLGQAAPREGGAGPAEDLELEAVTAVRILFLGITCSPSVRERS